MTFPSVQPQPGKTTTAIASASISPHNVPMSKSVLLLFKTLYHFIFFTLVLIIISPFALYRWILSKLVPQLLYPDVTHIASLHSNLYIVQDVQSDLWSNVLVRFKVAGTLNFPRIKAKITERLVYARDSETGALFYPELQQYLVKYGGYFFWKRVECFSVDDHVFKTHNSNGTVSSSSSGNRFSETEIGELETSYLKTAFNLNKSPWEILLVDNVEHLPGEPWFLVLLKFHHSLSDGNGILKALLKCVDEPSSVSTVVTAKQPKSPTAVSRFLELVTFPFLASYELAKLSSFKAIKLPWEVPCLDQSRGRVTQRHVFKSTGLISVSMVKSVARQNSVSFSAVILASICGGIRRFLEEYKQGGGVPIPDYMVCEVPVPVENHPDALTNSVCVVSFNLPVGHGSTNSTLHGSRNLIKRERLLICQQSVEDRSQSIEPRLTYFLFSLHGLTPTWFPSLPYRFPPVACSNFPGPTEPVKFDGHALFEMKYVLLSVPVVFAISILTYAGELGFFCTGDSRIFTSDDIKKLTTAIEDEFCQLEVESPGR